MSATKSLTFRKSSYSGGPQGACVEVATAGATRYIRDSKDKGGPVLAFAAHDFAAFVEDAKRNR